MEINKELVDKYLKGLCTPEEHAFVQAYLDGQGEEVVDFLPEEEWETWSVDVPTGYSQSRQDEVFNEIVQQLNEDEVRPVFHFSFLYRVVAAAILLFICAIGEQLTHKLQSPVLFGIQEQTPTLYRINASNQPMNILMSDSSTVLLYPDAEVRYAESFKWKSKREVWLIGKAEFTVHKDKTKPFMVYSDPLVTTALGTQFEVDAPRHGKQVAVRLIEGSIRVEDHHEQANGHRISQLLSPGEELHIQRSTLALMANSKKIAPPKERKTVAAKSKYADLVFKNTKLSLVFKEIDHIYGTNTRWTIPHIDELYFSGRYEREATDYQLILQDIAFLYHLTLEVDKNGKGAQLKQGSN